jgi:ABC-type glycerol-3-phosphate transport system permease component
MQETLAADGVKPAKKTGPRVSLRRTTSGILVHLIIITAAVLIGFPFFYMLSTSLKTVQEVYTIPMVILPAAPQWRNFVEVWNLLPFGRFTFNSVVYTVSITFGEFMMGLMAGYAFARLRFPKKDLIFFLVLLTFLIPGEITLIPRFIMLKQLNWINTYPGLIVPELSSAFATFLLREHFQSLPDELFDAAKIDGAGYFRQLMQIALPLSKPIVSTLLLLAFVAHWNAYMWPLVVTNSQSMRTLPIGVQSLRDVFEFPEWQYIMAGATIVVMPLVALFLIAQKQFIEGAVQGALKG